MPNNCNTGKEGGTEVATKKDFIEIVKRWFGDIYISIVEGATIPTLPERRVLSRTCKVGARSDLEIQFLKWLCCAVSPEVLRSISISFHGAILSRSMKTLGGNSLG